MARKKDTSSKDTPPEDQITETVEDAVELSTSDTPETEDDVSEALADESTEVEAQESDAEGTEESPAEKDAEGPSDDTVEPETSEEPETAEEPAEEDDHHDEVEHHEELESEGGSSIAARLLTWLVLILAGGGLALWGAPRVAPHLPNGLGPVKAWLMPGATAAQEDIAALRTDVEAQLAALSEQATGSEALDSLRTDLTGQIESATGALAGEVDEKIAGLSTSLSETVGSDFAERLSSLETQITGLEAEIGTLTSALTGIEGGEGVSTEALAQVAGFAAVVDGLKAEIGALAEREGALNTRIDQVAALAETRIEEAETAASEADLAAQEAQKAALVSAALAEVDAQARAGGSFADALAALSELTGTEAPAALSAIAGSGMPSALTLRNSFGDAAGDAIKAGIRETASEEGGMGARLGAFLSSQVATRSLEPQEGDDANAVLSRAQAAVNADDFSGALSELSTLAGAAADAMAPWVASTQSRLDALSALDGLSATLSPSN
ncbi:MAG: mitofilin family membrane protein [Pseudomonadota bacterium]